MIGIIGSGNVGANTAFFLAEKGVDHVLLYDIQEGMARGKALDIMEAAPLRGYRTTVHGTDNLEDILAADTIIIAAGSIRKPGMAREDLLKENRGIVEDLAAKIKNPYTIIIIATEPVDMLTMVFAEKSSLPLRRVMGLGGILDATRLRAIVAAELNVTLESVSAQAIGRHTRTETIFPFNYCCINGIPLDSIVSKDKVDELFNKARTAGDKILELARKSTAYYGPSAVAAGLAEAIVRDTGRILSVSHVLTGQYGLNKVAMSMPAVIRKSGVEQTLELQLSPDELCQLKTSAAHLTNVVQGGTA